MSSTPRTDAAIFKYGCKHCGPYKEDGVEPSFARQLETELAEARKRVRDLTDCLNFFRCTIKSGEAWSDECIRMYDKAMEDER